MARSLRPASADDLGMRRALSDRLLPLLVGAMVFLAALALAGAMAAASLAARWNTGAAALMTVTVPAPETLQNGITRAEAVTRILASSPGLSTARRLSEPEIAALLKPWLGGDSAALLLHLPAIFDVRVTTKSSDPTLGFKLDQAAPGTLVQRNGGWLSQLAALVRSLQACAALALAIVTFVAAAIVGVATRAGLAARRDAIEIVHGLGATDRMIAGQFAHRITVLALAGGLGGIMVALPVLIGLAALSAPFTAAKPRAVDALGLFQTLPSLLWALLAALPVVAAVIAWLTAQATVRTWLHRLP